MRMNNLKALVCGVCLMGMMSEWAAAAEVLARLDRTQVVEGETVTLVLQTSDPSQSLEADFSALEQDFLLLDRRSETQMSIVSGRQTAVVRLLLTLEPKRSGDLKVPALQFSGARTEPLLLNVEPAPELAPGEASPVFIELALDPIDGPFYVHAQLSLTVKIFYQQNLTEATINPPAPDQASVRLLDEVPFPAERNGVRYRVLQRRYAIFPERSGTLEIPPMRLTGRLIERPNDRLWQPSVRGRRVTEESEALSVEVLPRPADFQGDHWLPARQVTLAQQVSETSGIRVGEPVTRTVILDAVGLEENMLEEPVWPELNDARIYPDQPQGISRDDGQWVRGHKEFRYAIVPEVAGELVLPEIRLDWWDTMADRARTAIVPELRIAVAPLDLAPSATANLPGASAMMPGVISAESGEAGLGNGWRTAAIVLGVLWLVTLVLLLRRWVPEVGKAGRASPGVAENEAALLKELQQSCKRGDAAATRAHLRHWLKRYGPTAAQGSLLQFAGALHEEADLRQALRSFEASGYRADESSAWDGKALWKAFSEWHRDAGSRSAEYKDSRTPDLYAPAR